MTALVRAEGITKRFGRVTALKNVSFTLNEGESVGLVGPNGAGKSTLMSILCGYLQPTEGALKIAGALPKSPEAFGLIGALPQDALLHPSETVGEQLSFLARLQGFGRREAQREARRVIRLVRLEDNFHDRPKSLSHGMAKRIAIAQAIIGKPKLIVLDEPTAGLDPETARYFRQLLQELRTQTTLLVSSHNLDELENLCERTLFLEKGTLQDVVSDDDTTRAYLTLEVYANDVESMINALRTLTGVLSVQRRGLQSILIEYTPAPNRRLDLETLELLYQNQWRYRSLIFGRTLEDQLFGDLSE